MWISWCVFLYLLLLSALDVKARRVPVFMLSAGGLATGVISLYEMLTGQMDFLQPILGSLPGIFLLLIAWLSKKAGYADGIVLLWLGILYGYRTGFFILSASLLLISLVAIVLLMLRKVKRQTQIPYIPFLAAGFWIANVTIQI